MRLRDCRAWVCSRSSRSAVARDAQASARDSVLFMAGSGDSPPPGPLRLAELLASVSLATDLGPVSPLATPCVPARSPPRSPRRWHAVRRTSAPSTSSRSSAFSAAHPTRWRPPPWSAATSGPTTPRWLRSSWALTGSCWDATCAASPPAGPGAAPSARHPRARRSEARGAFAVHALRGRRDAGRARRSGAAGRRCPGPCVRALGRERVSRQTRRRRHPAGSTHCRRGERRRSRHQA